MRTRPLLFAMLAGLVAGSAAHAGEYYKWTDAGGTVHYTQTPPPGHASKTVYVDDGTPVQPLPGMDGQPQTAQQKKQAQAERSALQKTDRQAATANCATAEQNQSRLRQGAALARTDNPDVRALTPEQRQQAAADATAQIARYCSSGKQGAP